MLPIQAYATLIADTVRDNPVTIIAAETGAGKSTIVPLILLLGEVAGAGMIGVTQPRRIAAMSVSERVASIHGSALGATVGYQVKADRVTSDATRIKFMTEGILLRELHHDPMLRRYGVVIVDEAHERGVNQDLLLALLKGVLARRADLKVVVMSATLNEDRFSKYFDGAPVVRVPGRTFPVDVHYAQETPFGMTDVIKALVAKVKELLTFDHGDILAFLPDEASIRKACDELGDTNARILPLYGSQDPAEQRDVFRRDGGRRVILATNIAETSLTIDGIRHVVDSGKIKEIQYINASMSALAIVDHSRAGCDQRAGRAGRTAPGVCHRLFTREDHLTRREFTKPEIQRMTLDQVLLHLRVLGHSFEEVVALPFLDPPAESTWNEALERLRGLGAIAADGSVTEDGLVLESLPVDPMLGRMLLTAHRYGCVREVSAIVAGYSSRPVFVRPRGKDLEADAAHAAFKGSGSDALALLEVYGAWKTSRNPARWAKERYLSGRALEEMDRNRDHILDALERKGIGMSRATSLEDVRKAVASGLIVNLCKRAGYGHEFQWHGRVVYVHPGSAAFSAGATFLVCTEVMATGKQYARGCTPVTEALVKELLPEEVLTVKYELQMGYLGVPTRLMKTCAWQGTVLSTEEVSTLTDAARQGVAASIAESAFSWGEAHRDVPVLRRLVDRLREAKGVGILARHGHPAMEEVRKRLTAHVAERIAHAQTVDEVLMANLTFHPAEWLEGAERSAYESRYGRFPVEGRLYA